MVHITAKVSKQGNAHRMLVKKALVDCGVLEEGCTYEWKLVKKVDKSCSSPSDQESRKWGGADMALQMVCKRLRHSSAYVTAYHYLREFEGLQVNKYVDQDIAEIVRLNCQEKLKLWLSENENTAVEKPLCLY